MQIPISHSKLIRKVRLPEKVRTEPKTRSSPIYWPITVTSSANKTLSLPPKVSDAAAAAANLHWANKRANVNEGTRVSSPKKARTANLRNNAGMNDPVAPWITTFLEAEHFDAWFLKTAIAAFFIALLLLIPVWASEKKMEATSSGSNNSTQQESLSLDARVVMPTPVSGGNNKRKREDFTESSMSLNNESLFFHQCKRRAVYEVQILEITL